MVVFGVLFLILSFVSKEVPSPKLPTGKNRILGIASFVMVAGLGVDMFSILQKIIPANQGSSEIFISLLKSNLSKNGGTFTITENNGRCQVNVKFNIKFCIFHKITPFSL